jgi:hypothetical protein
LLVALPPYRCHAAVMLAKLDIEAMLVFRFLAE